MNSVFLNVGRRHKKILFNEILYVEASKNYVRIHTLNSSFIANYTLKEIEGFLPSTLFFRIHKSYLVAVDKITEFDCETVYIEKLSLPLSLQFCGPLKSKLNIATPKKRIKSKTSVDQAFFEN